MVARRGFEARDLYVLSRNGLLGMSHEWDLALVSCVAPSIGCCLCCDLVVAGKERKQGVIVSSIGGS